MEEGEGGGMGGFESQANEEEDPFLLPPPVKQKRADQLVGPKMPVREAGPLQPPVQVKEEHPQKKAAAPAYIIEDL